MNASPVVAAPPAFEMCGITAGYGRTTVLHDVNLVVPHGTVAALLGPNGAGKSTLLKVAAGLLRSNAGSVRIDGSEVSRAAPYKRNRAGLCLIPEGRGVFRNLTVRENLFVQVTRRERAEAIERALQAFPVLRSRLNQVASTMSGGEQQMLALARCYLAKPNIILVDEVSMGLAPIIVQQVFEAFAVLKRNGASIVLVEQYVDRALELADSVHLMNRGQLSHAGTPKEVDREELMRQYVGETGVGLREDLKSEAATRSRHSVQHHRTGSNNTHRWETTRCLHSTFCWRNMR